MIRAGAEPHDEVSFESERGELVADALFSSWSYRPDGFSQPFERGSLVVGQRREVLVNGLGRGFDLGLGSHGSSP